MLRPISCSKAVWEYHLLFCISYAILESINSRQGLLKNAEGKEDGKKKLAGIGLALSVIMLSQVSVLAYEGEDSAAAPGTVSVSEVVAKSGETEIPGEETLTALKGISNAFWQEMKNVEYDHSWSDWNVEAEYHADSLDASQKAYFLSCLVYRQQDARVQSVDQFTSAVSKSDLRAIMEETFGTVSDEDMDQFLSTYPQSIDGEVCYFPATGGFGAPNGPIGMKDPDQVFMESDILTLQGDLYTVNQLPSDAESVGRYTVTYRKTDSSVLGGFTPESIITMPVNAETIAVSDSEEQDTNVYEFLPDIIYFHLEPAGGQQ